MDSKNFLFLMDPLELIIINKDTSFVLMLEAFRRKHRVFFVANDGIFRKNGKTYFHVSEVEPRKRVKQPFVIIKRYILSEQKIDAIFVRTDPPFNESYLLNTWLLDLLPVHIPVINRPSGIRTVNEKVWVTQFGELTPETLIANDKKSILAFIKENQDVIVKPINGFGGQSVFKISAQDTNCNVILETLTTKYSQKIITQRYIQLRPAPKRHLRARRPNRKP